VPAAVSTAPPAVTPAQGRVERSAAEVVQPAGPPVTADEPALPQPKPGVAPTLPPDDTAPQGPQGGTQEASKDLIAHLAAQNAAAQAVPLQQAPIAAPAYTASPAPTGVPYGSFGPPVRRPRKSGLGMIVALLSGLFVTGLVIAGVAWMRQNKGDGTEPIGGLGGPAPNTTITAQGGSTEPTPPPDVPHADPVPEPGPGPKPTATGSGKPRPKDAGADASQEKDAGSTGPWPFPLPSGLPPLPSNLPPLPTFPIPGFQPPPASS
jgi:hypothetical protein